MTGATRTTIHAQRHNQIRTADRVSDPAHPAQITLEIEGDIAEYELDWSLLPDSERTLLSLLVLRYSDPVDEHPAEQDVLTLGSEEHTVRIDWGRAALADREMMRRLLMRARSGH